MSNQGDGSAPENGGEQQGDTGGQWTGGHQQPWATGGQQPWATDGQDPQPPSWSTGQTGPNVGPTMNNPQNSYYDRFSEASGEGITGPQQGGGNGGGRGKILIGLAAALVLIVAVVAIFALTRGDDSSKKAAGSSTTKSLAPVKATTWINPTLAAGARALKDGWKSQTSDSEALRGQYDVPDNKDWKVQSNSFSLGYADASGTPIAMGGAVSEYKLGFCSADKKLDSAWIGIRGVGNADPSDTGSKWAEKFAEGIAADKEKPAKPGKVSAAKKIKVNQGTIPALQYTVTTESGGTSKCAKGKKYEVRTINFSTPGKTYQMVTVRILGIDEELPADQLDEIISTFRPQG